jgi:hypothetical protein
VQFKNPNEAMENLEKQACRILLKRPENHDPHFRELIDLLFRQVMELHGGLGNEKIIRLESSVFISSAAATTPLHFDPEVGFFSQIEGEKFYHAYAPADVSEPELERFYKRGVVDIAQVPLNKRDPQLEHVFDLLPGKSFHQPQNSPHWVRTGNERSISYTFVFETEAGRALGRTRAFNHYVRKMRMSPALPGVNPAKDARKAGFMQTVLPVRIKIDRVYARVIEPTRKLGSIMVRKSGVYPFYKKHFAPSASGDE